MPIKTFSQGNLIIGILSGLFAGSFLPSPYFISILLQSFGELVGLSNIFNSLHAIIAHKE